MQTFYMIWARRALLNLLIVALAGSLLRYKILWSIPSLDYKDLMHAHSHFAFSGWVSLALSVAMAGVLDLDQKRSQVYNLSLWFLLLSAFGMLLSFPFGGYNPVSIFFSTLSIVSSWVFAAIVWKDLSGAKLSPSVKNWFRAGLFFYVISAAGPFFLAWLMASGNGHQQWYIGSVYYYLHFQYNGWFSFCVIGLFLAIAHKRGLGLPEVASRYVFWLFFISCIPAFFLSALWMELPAWLYWPAVLAAIMQVLALIILITAIFRRRKYLSCFNKLPRILWTVALLAFTMKCIMQLLSVIPALSYLAFGYRPVVIGYLHLILLGFVTMFLLGLLIQQQYIMLSTGKASKAVYVFVGGVILNEVFLFVQALSSIAGTNFSQASYLLLAAALVMLSGISILYISQLNNNLFKYGISSNKQRRATASTS